MHLRFCQNPQACLRCRRMIHFLSCSHAQKLIQTCVGGRQRISELWARCFGCSRFHNQLPKHLRATFGKQRVAQVMPTTFCPGASRQRKQPPAVNSTCSCKLQSPQRTPSHIKQEQTCLTSKFTQAALLATTPPRSPDSSREVVGQMERPGRNCRQQYQTNNSHTGGLAASVAFKGPFLPLVGQGGFARCTTRPKPSNSLRGLPPSCSAKRAAKAHLVEQTPAPKLRSKYSNR